MNTYKKQFIKYLNLSRSFANRPNVTYTDLITEVKKLMVQDDVADHHALLVLGFSGNGKTTIITEFISENPDYDTVSMDAVAKRVYKQERSNPEIRIIEEFGDEIEKKAASFKNIIIDGNFLNLLTRCALIDTLKTLGYQVDVIDITKHIHEILPFRIEDVASKRLGVPQNMVGQYKKDPRFIAVEKEINDFYLQELKRSSFDLQQQNGVVSLGVQHVYERSEISKISFPTRTNGLNSHPKH